MMTKSTPRVLFSVVSPLEAVPAVPPDYEDETEHWQPTLPDDLPRHPGTRVFLCVRHMGGWVGPFGPHHSTARYLWPMESRG